MFMMIFVMLSISMASVERINEVLNTESTIVSPENGLTEVTDGSISFDHVDFSYTDENGDPCTVRIRLKAYPVRGTAFVDTWTKTGGFSMHLESEVPLGDAENIP